MSAPILSVVIPTRDRLASLKLALEALARQQIPAGTFEVIVADDGSRDGTPGFLANFPPLPFAFRSVSLSGSGPARARNRAIALASAPRVLLLGDDTFPRSDVLSAHLAAAGDRAVAVQGRVEWDPEAPVTPVMRFLAPEGPQFYFRRLAHGQEIPYTSHYGANFSAPATWFREEPYGEMFPDAAFEDTELGYRWRARGWHAIYWQTAVCDHRHHYESIEPFLIRQRKAGRGARLAALRHPGLAGETIFKPLAVGAVFAARYGLRRLAGEDSQRDRWDLQVRTAFLSGLVGLGLGSAGE
jgi:glycosyltransferase involved in cell wall biosynthesis